MVEENKGQEGKAELKGDAKTFTQEQVDHIIQERVARLKAQYPDYDELKTFKSEYEKTQDAKQLQILEEQKKYQEAKETYEAKIKERDGLLSKKDQEIQDIKITSSLVGEVSRQNAYAEEALALLKSTTLIDKDGNVRIKGRDANGLEVLHSVEEGVKKFLEGRPHLVKASGRQGGGVPPGGGSGQVAGQEGDPYFLGNELMKAQARGDYKKVKELSSQLRTQVETKRVG